MGSVRKISGFPEWLPEGKLFEDSLIRSIRQSYELFGFTPIETSAVELLSTLGSKGTVEKEIYALRRLHAEPGEEEEFGLHFDLTVPFARYVAQNFSKLIFPFRRYQLQKVWRGERPQKGRYREFYQFDLDIIARDELPIACDAEVLNAFAHAFAKLPLPRIEVLINNRKILHGFYRSLGLSEAQRTQTISIVDKLHKIGPAEVRRLLIEQVGAASEAADKVLEFSSRRFRADELGDLPQVDDEIFSSGVAEIREAVSLCDEAARSLIILDLSLARGLDYYTGLIFETVMPDHPEYGSIGSGGRYENLASEFTSQKLPGVGGSIGLTRIAGFLIDREGTDLSKKSPVELLVTVYDENQRLQCNQVARQFRAQGISTEVFYRSPKLGKQIDYADQRGIRWVAFVREPDQILEIKDLQTKTQAIVSDIAQFCRDAIVPANDRS